MSETYRVGRHQAHNIYRVTAERPEGVQIGCMFDAADGPLVVAALNASLTDCGMSLPRSVADLVRSGDQVEVCEGWDLAGPEVVITRPDEPCTFCTLTGGHTAICAVSTGRYE